MTSLYPVFEAPLPAADGFDGSSLSRDLNELDHIATFAGLTTLSQFIDARTMALEVLEEDQLPENCPPVRWYPAQEGLSTIQKLLLHYHQPTEDALELKSALVAELGNLAGLLQEANAKGIQFHLLVDI